MGRNKYEYLAKVRWVFAGCDCACWRKGCVNNGWEMKGVSCYLRLGLAAAEAAGADSRRPVYAPPVMNRKTIVLPPTKQRHLQPEMNVAEPPLPFVFLATPYSSTPLTTITYKSNSTRINTHLVAMIVYFCKIYEGSSTSFKNYSATISSKFHCVCTTFF